MTPYRDFQLATIAAYAVMIAGLTVLVGPGGRVSFGQGALAGVGGYTQAVLTTRLGLPTVAAVVVVLMVSAALGAGLGHLTAGLPGPSFAVVTLVLAVAVPSIPSGLPASFGGSAGLVVAPFAAPTSTGMVQRWQAVACCVAAVLTLTALANLLDSAFGRSLRAVRDNPSAAELGGLSAHRLRTAAVAVAAACAGLGGALLTTIIGIASPDGFPLSLSLTLLAGVVLGGVGSLSGAVAGAGLLVVLPVLSGSLTSWLHLSVAAGANLPLAAYGLAVIAIVRLAPAGLAPVLSRLARLGR
ncbi:MAG: hypothetical protein NVSMB13_18160 [Mycobacteriales bacterium]